MHSVIIGTHQKFNKQAYKSLGNLTTLKNFPSIKEINYFEGRRGPDNIKSKRFNDTEVVHLYDPLDPTNTKLITYINKLYDDLVKDLRNQNQERSAFGASWLSHAMVDGMTPAHHFPYEEKMNSIRGKRHPTETSLRSTVIAKGHNKREIVKNNWMLWGAKGLILTHFLFELGVDSIVFTRKNKIISLSEQDIENARELGVERYFIKAAKRVAKEFAYEDYYQHGWNSKLGRWVRDNLITEILEVIVTVWYLALKEAGMANPVTGRKI